MHCLNLFANAEITSLRFLGLFGSVFATFWMLLDLMWACEKVGSSFCSVTRFAAVAVAILSLTRCRYFLFFLSLNSQPFFISNLISFHFLVIVSFSQVILFSIYFIFWRDFLHRSAVDLGAIIHLLKFVS